MRLTLKPPKVFYGWWIVGASLLISLVVGGTVYRGFTAMFEPIADEFGWSYAQISLAASLRGLEFGLLAPVTGILVDRLGPRKMLVFAGLSLGLGLFLLGQTTSLAMFYGAFVVMSLGVSSCASTVLMAAVANWFQGRVGLASGLALAGFGLGGLMIPLITKLIDMYDWRMTLNILAVGVLVTVLPLSLLFRHKPEQYGYLPDGVAKREPATPNHGLTDTEIVEPRVTAKQVIKSRLFWYLSLAFVCRSVLVGSMSVHIMPYLSSVGISRSLSSLVATVLALVDVGPRIVFGWLGDKMGARLVGIVVFALMSLGMIFFEYVSSDAIWILVPYLILFGAGVGGSSVLRASMVREFFGRATFGTVYGAISGISMLGTIVGAPLTGLAFDKWGSYQGIWLLFAGVSVVAIVFLLTMPRVTTTTQSINRD